MGYFVSRITIKKTLNLLGFGRKILAVFFLAWFSWSPRLLHPPRVAPHPLQTCNNKASAEKSAFPRLTETIRPLFVQRKGGCIMVYSWTKRSMLNFDFSRLTLYKRCPTRIAPRTGESPPPKCPSLPPSHFYNVHVVPIRVQFPCDLPLTKLTGSREFRPIL